MLMDPAYSRGTWKWGPRFTRTRTSQAPPASSFTGTPFAKSQSSGGIDTTSTACIAKSPIGATAHDNHRASSAALRLTGRRGWELSANYDTLEEAMAYAKSLREQGGASEEGGEGGGKDDQGKQAAGKEATTTVRKEPTATKKVSASSIIDLCSFVSSTGGLYGVLMFRALLLLLLLLPHLMRTTLLEFHGLLKSYPKILR